MLLSQDTRTAVYCRLSREDGNEESQSIQAQKEILVNYVHTQGWQLYDIYIDEIPLKEMIEKEQRMLRHRLICQYASEKLGDLSVREFNRLMREDDSDEKNQMFYEGLRDLLKRLRLSEYLEKRLETDKLSHAEFCEIRNALCSAKIGEEFEKINLAATAKYGKAVND